MKCVGLGGIEGWGVLRKKFCFMLQGSNNYNHVEQL